MTESPTGIEPPEVGSSLRRGRSARGMDLEEAAATSGLTLATIQRLEGDDPAEWGGDMLMLARLRIYARLLGQDPEPMVAAAWRASGRSWQGPPPPNVEPLMPGRTRSQRRRRRRLLVGLLCAAVILIAGTAVGAIRATDDGTAIPDAPESDTPAAGQDPGDEQPDEEAEEPAPEIAEDDGLPTAEDALPGRPPQETPVQVLNALEDEEATAQAVAELESLGYEIVLVDTTAQTWSETAVYYNPGWDTEAESLEARDPRFPVGGENESFVDEAGLHVVVGLDWGQ